METAVRGKMKRKGLGEVYDDFTDLSFSTPATKIRRLDAEFPPIIEAHQPVVGSILEDELSEGGISNAAPNAGLISNEPFFPPSDNEERALVLYKPVYTQLGPSLKIDPALVPGLKKSALWPAGNRDIVEENFGEGYQSSHIDCLAMVPWIPSQSCFSAPVVSEEEPMEAEVDGSSMEIEDVQSANSGVEGESFHQWQKHCMIPELTQTNSSAPITWLLYEKN